MSQIQFFNEIWFGVGSLILTICFIIYSRRPRKERTTNVPIVSGQLPIFGHALWIWWDNPKFLTSCYDKYGPVFQIKIFFTTIVLICDRELVSPFLKAKENIMSLGTALVKFNFDLAVFDSNILPDGHGASVFRKGLQIPMERVIPLLTAEATSIVQGMKRKCEVQGGSFHCHLYEEMFSFMTRLIYTAVAPMDLNAIPLSHILTSYKFANNLINMAMVFPKWFMRLCHYKHRFLRRQAAVLFETEIQKWRESDDSSSQSTLIEYLLNMENNNGRKLSNAEIADTLIGFMYMATLTTPLGLTQVLTYLAMEKNARFLNKLRSEILECEDILKAPFMHACVMETGRFSFHPYLLPRTPQGMDISLGDFKIGKDVDHISPSPIMLQVYGDAGSVFKNPREFNPERFMGSNPEPMDPRHILTWGGAVHYCPGKNLAISSIKIALAQLVLAFDFEIASSTPPLFFTRIPTSPAKSFKLIFRPRKTQH